MRRSPCWPGLGFLLLLGPVNPLAGAGEAPERRPNVLLLLADDLGSHDLGCTGAPHTRTPALDRLAGEGLRFTSFYAGAPNCSPSRAALLTGRVPARCGIYNYIPDHGPLHLPRTETTVAELLRDAGYATAHFGKWHLNHDLQDPELPQPRDHGFQTSLATENNAAPSHLDPVNFFRDGVPEGPREGYSCQIVVDELLRWLEEPRPEDQPFFVCAWFHETHTPIASPPELMERHADAAIKDAKYRANVESLDAAIGRLLQGIDRLGHRDDTLVWFSSDNGGLRAESNGGLRGRKSFVWEGGIRVPGIVRWPGVVEAGTRCEEAAGLIDLLPTLCAAAGVARPAELDLDGLDLGPALRGEPLHRERPLFWFFYRTAPACALREGRHVVVGWLEEGLPRSHPLNAAQMAWLRSAKLVRFELYDVVADPEQREDLSAELPERAAELRALLQARHAAVVAEGPTWFGVER